MKLSSRLLLSMTGIVVAVVLVAGLMVWRLFTPLLESADLSGVRADAALVENLHRNRLDAGLQLARKLAAAPGVRAAMKDASARLDEALSDPLLRGGYSVAVVKADGTLVDGPDRTPPELAALLKHPLLRAALTASRAGAAQAGLVSAAGALHAVAVAPVAGEDAALGAVLVAMPVDDAYAQGLAQPGGAAVAVFAGAHLAGIGLVEQEGPTAVPADLRAAAEGAAASGLAPKLDAAPRAAAATVHPLAVGASSYRAIAAPLADPAGEKQGWYLVMRPADRSVQAQVWLTRYLALIGALAIGVAALLSLWLARATAAPIQHLARRLREVEGLATSPGVEERDEIEVIAAKLRGMLATLKLKQEQELAEQKVQLQQAQARAAEQAALKRASEQYIALIEELAAGNLTVRFPEDGPPEMAQLGRHLNMMVRGVSQVIANVQDAVAHLSVSSAEILNTLTQQVENYRFQDDAMSRTGVAIENLRITASRTAEEAEKVVDRTGASTRAFQEADGAAKSTLAAMEEIHRKAEESSKSMRVLLAHIDKIDHIVSAVNEIAEQSNLLSLNAAIEAARAAEVGRGFAVVAQEVRNLAVQSKQCTSEIKKVLGDVRSASDAVAAALKTAGDEVDHGTGLMGQVRNLQDSLRQTLDDSMQLASKVKTASTSQAKELEGLTRGMKDAIQRLGQNFASVQAIREALKDLSTLSEGLRDTSATFHTEESPRS